jgi:hypothetical protein
MIGSLWQVPSCSADGDFLNQVSQIKNKKTSNYGYHNLPVWPHFVKIQNMAMLPSVQVRPFCYSIASVACHQTTYSIKVLLSETRFSRRRR